jgi:type I restriction enzyme M protein
MSSNTSNEGEIRKKIIEADLVDCMIALPSQLFYNTMIPACLWFIARDKQNNAFRNRSGETLFIDVRNFGVMVDRSHRELTVNDIKKISNTYHAWRGEPIDGQTIEYQDVPGFCSSVKVDEIGKQGYILTPGRYVGSEEEPEEEQNFEERMKKLVSSIENAFAESKILEDQILDNLRRIDYCAFK